MGMLSPKLPCCRAPRQKRLRKSWSELSRWPPRLVRMRAPADQNGPEIIDVGKGRAGAHYESGGAPAASAAAHRDRRLTARNQHARWFCRLSVPRGLLGNTGVHQPDVARLAFDRAAEDQRPEPGISRNLRGGFESVLRHCNDTVRHVAKTDVTGLWRLRCRLS